MTDTLAMRTIICETLSTDDRRPRSSMMLMRTASKSSRVRCWRAALRNALCSRRLTPDEDCIPRKYCGTVVDETATIYYDRLKTFGFPSGKEASISEFMKGLFLTVSLQQASTYRSHFASLLYPNDCGKRKRNEPYAFRISHFSLPAVSTPILSSYTL